MMISCVNKAAIIPAHHFSMKKLYYRNFHGIIKNDHFDNQVTMQRIGFVLSVVCAVILLAACSSAPAPRGEVHGMSSGSREMGQSDTNRVATIAMQSNLQSLYLLMDKLYRRNPGEWKKTAASREEAIQRVRGAIEQRAPWPALGEQRDIAALSLALTPEFSGDRVAAFIYASADMIITAHNGKTEFFLIDSLDAQHLYNAARNVEIANWLLASRRNEQGEPLLLADDINEEERNLSFEREFGKIVARLDLLAVFITEKYRRAGINYVQNLLGGSFIQFLPVR